MRATIFALVALLSLPVVLTACATAVDTVEHGATDMLVPVSEEEKLGRQLSAELEKKSRMLQNKEVVSYVQTVGRKVVAKAGNPDGWHYTFSVIDDPKTVNAFAMPAGHIYVYSGLLKMMRDEAELAGVLSHEVAHVTKRHIAQRMAASYGLEKLSELALGKDPGQVGELASAILVKGALLKNSRQDETEADKLGVAVAAKAGYAPMGLVDFLQLLKQQEGKSSQVLSFLSDHPATADRISTLQEEIRTQHLRGSERNVQGFQVIKAKL
jgi:predicted Zn-dependent protease